jgi:MFS family permease
MGVVSLSYHAGFMDAPMVVANNWFIRKRTLAMSLISGSVGLGGFLLTPLLSAAVHAFGWRNAAFGNGLVFLIGGLPLALLVRRSPESMGLRPDGDTDFRSGAGEGRHSARRVPVEEVNFTLAAALRTASFWLLTIATAIRVVTLSAVTVHYVPIMVWKGVSAQRAAFFLAAQAFLSLPFSVLFGWIADRVNKPKLMSLCMLLATVSAIVLIYAQNEWQILLFLPLFGMIEYTFPINWSTVGEFFGRKHFAKIRGTMTFIHTWGSVIGPVSAGIIYDRTLSYLGLLWLSVALLFLASALYFVVVKPSQT